MNDASPIEEAIRYLVQVEAETSQLVIPLLDELDRYLALLREEVPRQVFQAVFLLATQYAPDHYESISAAKRKKLQRRLQQLTMRCSCLLTVEQLLPLARRLHREHHLMKQQSRASEVLETLQQLDDTSEEADEAPQPRAGDITLEFDSPVTSTPDLAVSPFNPAEVATERTPSQDADHDRGLPHRELSLATLSSLLSSVAEETPGDPQELRAEAEQERKSPMRPNEEAGFLTLPLPRDPQWLERWNPWLHQALSHRLRNLSHGVNVELLKLGLIRALLPLNLLDAVLSGDVEVMAAPANLLRIAIPIGGSSPAPQVVTRSVLLRLNDMEFESLPMRRRRKHLDQYQQRLLELAKRSRHWQKNFMVAKAAASWHEDLRPPNPPQP